MRIAAIRLPGSAMPRPANTKPTLAWSARMRTSMGRVIEIPTPTADPLMAAMTGLVERKMRSTSRPPPSRGAAPDLRAETPWAAAYS